MIGLLIRTKVYRYRFSMRSRITRSRIGFNNRNDAHFLKTRNQRFVISDLERRPSPALLGVQLELLQLPVGPLPSRPRAISIRPIRGHRSVHCPVPDRLQRAQQHSREAGTIQSAQEEQPSLCHSLEQRQVLTVYLLAFPVAITVSTFYKTTCNGAGSSYF